MSSKAALADYPFVIELPLSWGDMDAFGHLNNIVYFRYFEDVRMAAFEQIGVPASMERTGSGPILAETSCRFRSPLHYPDTLAVGTATEDVGSDRFVMRYAVASVAAAGIAAEGYGRIVWYDYRKGCRTDMPAEVRRELQALSGPARSAPDRTSGG